MDTSPSDGFNLGVPRCIRPECGGLLAMSGQGVSRFVCQKCNQHYVVHLYYEPVDSKEPLKALPGDRAE